MVESSTKKLLGVVALVYVLPVIGFLLGYFLSEEGCSRAGGTGSPWLRRCWHSCPVWPMTATHGGKELLTYTILRVF